MPQTRPALCFWVPGNNGTPTLLPGMMCCRMKECGSQDGRRQAPSRREFHAFRFAVVSEYTGLAYVLGMVLKSLIQQCATGFTRIRLKRVPRLT